MNKSLFAGGYFNKRAEVHKAGNNALVDSADLGVIGYCLNHVESALSVVNVDSGDEYGSVLLNVDLAVALCADLLDNLALLADDIADLLGVDLGGEHLGSILGELFSGLGDNGQHNFIEDVAACLVGLVKSLADNSGGQTVYFKIHLDSGDALLRAGDLEVHVAEEVLETLDINHGHEAVALGNKAAGDTGNGSLYRHAGRHKGEGRAADGSLRGRAVGRKNLGDEAQAVRELLNARDNGQKSALRKCAVTYLAASGASGGLGLADGVGGEIVVVHIALGILAVDTVENLRVADGAEGGDGQNLSLASGEHTRAVNSVEQVDFSRKRANLIDASAVNALAVVKQPAAYDKLLGLVKAVINLLYLVGINLVELLMNLLIDGLEALVTDALVIGVKSDADIVNGEILDSLIHLGCGIV